jgi:predicted nucleic acid-binding protein
VIILDTSVWIEYFRQGNEALTQKVVDYLDNGMVVGISAVFGELLQGARNEEEEKIILEFWQNIVKVDEQTLFVDAGRLSNKYKLLSKGVGLIDAYLLAAAKEHRLSLWTLDKRLADAFLKM